MDSDSGKGHRKEETYCICKSKDDKRFMICCDGCNRWYHGDCVNLKSEQAKKIKQYYCHQCQKDKKLCIEFKQQKTANDSDSEPNKKKPRKEKECGNCIGCFRTEDCGRCDICKSNRPENQDASTTGRKSKCRLRHCVNLLTPVVPKGILPKKKDLTKSKDNVQAISGGVKLKNVPKKKPHTTPYISPAKSVAPVASDNALSSECAVVGGQTRAGARALKDFMTEAGLLCEEDRGDELRQCLGPGCVLPARRGSKYCSDETCGLRLARNRILEILPSRLQQWNLQPTIAEEFEKRRLEQIESQMEAAKLSLDRLADEEQKLNHWLEATKTVKWDGETETDDADDECNNVYCPTCGHETSAKNALRHINRCFTKYENQTSFGSAIRTLNNVYQIFCDTFNKSSGTFCKRLRVICPEHRKETKVDDDEVCGAPLATFGGCGRQRSALLNDNLSPGADFCQAQKKACLKHYKWEKIRRAIIDTERLAQLLKVDELYDENRALRATSKARGSVLALLLHQTIKHDSDEVNNGQTATDNLYTATSA